MSDRSLRQLRRVRWAVRAVLTLGVAASVAANILHADPNPIAQAIAAWPPLALLLTVELISRIPVHRRSLAAVRLGATATIAGIAAWVSYWHMAGVAARYGETGAAPYLLPLSVDGLVVVASVSLVELAGRLRDVQERPEIPEIAADAATTITADDAELIEAKPAPAMPQQTMPQQAMPQQAMPQQAMPQQVAPQPVMWEQPVPAGALISENLRESLGEHFGERLAAGRPRPRVTTPATARATASARVPAQATPTRKGRPVEETRRLAAELAANNPEATAEDLARHLGITTRRLKQVMNA